MNDLLLEQFVDSHFACDVADSLHVKRRAKRTCSASFFPLKTGDMDIWLPETGIVRVHPHRRTCESPVDVLLAQSQERHTMKILVQYSLLSPH